MNIDLLSPRLTPDDIESLDIVTGYTSGDGSPYVEMRTNIFENLAKATEILERQIGDLDTSQRNIFENARMPKEFPALLVTIEVALHLECITDDKVDWWPHYRVTPEDVSFVLNTASYALPELSSLVSHAEQCHEIVLTSVMAAEYEAPNRSSYSIYNEVGYLNHLGFFPSVCMADVEKVASKKTITLDEVKGLQSGYESSLRTISLSIEELIGSDERLQFEKFLEDCRKGEFTPDSEDYLSFLQKLEDFALENPIKEPA